MINCSCLQMSEHDMQDKLSALEQLPAAFRGLTAPRVHHNKPPGSTMAPSTAKPSSCMHRVSDKLPSAIRGIMACLSRYTSQTQRPEEASCCL